MNRYELAVSKHHRNHCKPVNKITATKTTSVQFRQYNRGKLFGVVAYLTSKLESGGHWHTTYKGIAITPPCVPQTKFGK